MSNSNQIARDPLRAVFEFLDADDWCMSHQWRVCRWWYFTMRNATSFRLRCKLPDVKHGVQSFITSSLSHHFTQIDVTESAHHFGLLASPSSRIRGNIKLLQFNNISNDWDFSPLLSLSRLHALIVDEVNEDLTIAQLRVIKQLPGLKRWMRQMQIEPRIATPWRSAEIIEVTTPPTRCAQWTWLELGRTSEKLSRRARSAIAKFTSLTNLDFGLQVDRDGIITHFSHLKHLKIKPYYSHDHERSHPIPSLDHIGQTIAQCRDLHDLWLDLSDFFPHSMEMRPASDKNAIYEPSVENATQQLKEAFSLASSSSSSPLRELYISNASTLSDLSFLSTLTNLRVLNLWRCWSLTPTSLVQIASSLIQLEWLEITFAYDRIKLFGQDPQVASVMGEIKSRYGQLNSLRPQLTSPSSLIPSLGTMILRLTSSESFGQITVSEADRPYSYL